MEARPWRSCSTTRRSVARASPQVVGQIVDVLVENAQVHGAGAVTLTLRAVDGCSPPTSPKKARVRRRPRSDDVCPTRREGHGIGLALARALADAQGARLVVTSPGPGPVLTLMLPAATR
jgi:signal transduction histidine kinase